MERYTERAEGLPIRKSLLPATIEDDTVRLDLLLDPIQQVVDAGLLAEQLVHLICEDQRPCEAEHCLANPARKVLGADIGKLDGLGFELLEEDVEVVELLEGRLRRFDVAAAR